MSTTQYKHITATGLVSGAPTQLYSVTLTGGSDAASITLRDWTDTTGGADVDVIKTAANTSNTVVYNKPVHIKTGLYATLTGTGVSATIYCDGNFTTTSTSTSTTTTSTSTTTTSTSTSTS